MVYFASSEPAIESVHWLAQIISFGTLVLALIAFTIVICVTFSNDKKLITGPFYLNKASSILKWIAVTSPIMMALGFLIEFYDSLYQIGIRGEFGLESWIGIVSVLILSSTIGLGVSLLCLVGLAIHFFRTMNSNE